MLQGTIKAVYKNIRYRLMVTEAGDYYLVDVETYLWDKIFPFLILLFPRKVYAITQEEYESLLHDIGPASFDDKALKKFPVLPLSILLTAILPINFLALPLVFLNQLYVVLCLLGVIIFHITYARSNKELIRIIRLRQVKYFKLSRISGCTVKLIGQMILTFLLVLMFGVPIYTNSITNILFYVMFFASLFGYSGSSGFVIPFNELFYYKNLSENK